MAKAKEVVAEVVTNVAEKVLDKLKVELVDVKKGTQTVYHKLGNTTFEDGVAEVSTGVAKELKESGLVK